jgi:uncharacterized protein (TIGR00730 family)
VKSLCVFCGSASGRRLEYAAAARELGRLLVKQGVRLVYGGGNIGLMGVLADEMMQAGGEVIGVIPRHLVEKEVAHHQVSELKIVGSMHERKALMADLADAFVALPGGIGTFEELFEILTWAQLGLHSKPCGILNVAGYFAPLLAMLQHATDESFLRPEHARLLVAASEPAELLTKLAEFQPVPREKWLDRDET